MSGVDRAPAEDAPHLKFARPRSIDEARPIAERAEDDEGLPEPRTTATLLRYDSHLIAHQKSIPCASPPSPIFTATWPRWMQYWKTSGAKASI